MRGSLAETENALSCLQADVLGGGMGKDEEEEEGEERGGDVVVVM